MSRMWQKHNRNWDPDSEKPTPETSKLAALKFEWLNSSNRTYNRKNEVIRHSTLYMSLFILCLLSSYEAEAVAGTQAEYAVWA